MTRVGNLNTSSNIYIKIMFSFAQDLMELWDCQVLMECQATKGNKEQLDMKA